jgi:tetratricopeptide (TPR) repeat protein
LLHVHNKIEAETLIDLLSYLERLQFLSSTGHTNEYIITGSIVKDIPSSPDIRTKEEGEFIKEYKKFQHVLLVYSNLFNTYTKEISNIRYSDKNFDQYRDEIINDVMKDKIGLFSSDLVRDKSILDPKIEQIYHDLTRELLPQEFRPLHKRNELEDSKDQIVTLRNEALRNFILLIKGILKHRKGLDVNSEPLSNAELEQILGMASVKLASFQNLLVKPKASGRNRQLLILQNVPPDITEIIKGTEIAKTDVYVYVVIINTTITDDVMQIKRSEPLEYDDKIDSLAHLDRKTRDIWFDDRNHFRTMEVSINEVLLRNLIRAIISWCSEEKTNEWNESGIAYYREERFDKATDEFNKVMKVFPEFPAAFYNKGKSLHKLGKYDEAIRSYDEAIKIDPNNSYALSEKGYSLHMLGKYDEAIRSYDEAIKIDPKHYYAWYYEGLSLHKLGKYDEAIRSYDEAIKIDPNNSYALSEKGYSLHMLGKYDEAIRSYDEAIKIDPNNYLASSRRESLLSDRESLVERLKPTLPRSIETDRVKKFKVTINTLVTDDDAAAEWVKRIPNIYVEMMPVEDLSISHDKIEFKAYFYEGYYPQPADIKNRIEEYLNIEEALVVRTIQVKKL